MKQYIQTQQTQKQVRNKTIIGLKYNKRQYNMHNKYKLEIRL